jgi:two-component system, NtrC family, sensor kinase
LLLLALAVSLPALFTCLILGFQLDRQARTLFANSLLANLETFSLLLEENERNLNEGLKRVAADNTLQITLDLEITAQLTKYIEEQRQVLNIAFFGVYDRSSRVMAFSSEANPAAGQWKLVESGRYGDNCVATRQLDQQLVHCNGTVYLVSVMAIKRVQDTSLGDASALTQPGLLGYLIGGSPLAGPALIASLAERQVVHPLIWVEENLVYANIPAQDLPPPKPSFGTIEEFDIAQTAYLGGTKAVSISGQRLVYSVFAPLAPLRTALLQSVVTVGGIGLLLIMLTLLAGGFITNRMLRPIQLLREGAERIGSGDLGQRISIKTGDELEDLADQFNEMGTKLEHSYADLENKVEMRTRELSQSLDDLQTAQDRLVQTEKLASLGQLTAGIAHEIKNPLNFVNNFSALSAELVDELKDVLTPAALDGKTRAEIDDLTGLLKANLEKVVQHGKRADSIVKNMLLHSREGSGEHRPANINTILDESLNLAYHGARAEGSGFNITLQRNFDSSAGIIELYPQEMTRVFLNLISNGFYAAHKRKSETEGSDFEPTLTATTRNLGNKVEIRIRDNGTGISPEVKEKMFEPFFTTKPAGEGTGLGLSMSHDIVVKQHGGEIGIETQPNQYTEFIITLPRNARSNGNSGVTP